jgi:V/A-type H+-transporting ATPase subunit A
MELLQKEQRLLQVVKLVGPDVLPQAQRLILEVCYIFKNAFLQQSAFDKVDTYCSALKQFLMLKVILDFYHKCEELVKRGINVTEIRQTTIYQEIMRMKTRYSEDQLEELKELSDKIDEAFLGLSV